MRAATSIYKNLLSCVAALSLGSALSFAETESQAFADSLLKEISELRTELSDSKQAAAAATVESEVFKRQVRELTLRMEALGGSPEGSGNLEQRFLQAVNALRHSETRKAELTKALAGLAHVATEALPNLSPELSTVFQAELKKVDDVLNAALMDSMVDASNQDRGASNAVITASVSAKKSELDCFVLNAGTDKGVKVGMSFQVLRKDIPIAKLKVVEVRSRFSGAVTQDVATTSRIELGDTVKLLTSYN
jgi:hypothetical protein